MKEVFRFRTIPELTDFVKTQGGIVHPFSMHIFFGPFVLTYLTDDPLHNPIFTLVNEKTFQWLEFDKEYLEKIRNGDIRRQFLTNEGDEQYFYFDDGKAKLFLISQILD